MSGGYYYLVASLPHLKFGAAPRLTPGEFLHRCAAQVSTAHYRILAEMELFQAQPAKIGLALLDACHALLAERFAIHHATLQPEPETRTVHWLGARGGESAHHPSLESSR